MHMKQQSQRVILLQPCLRPFQPAHATSEQMSSKESSENAKHSSTLSCALKTCGVASKAKNDSQISTNGTLKILPSATTSKLSQNTEDNGKLEETPELSVEPKDRWSSNLLDEEQEHSEAQPERNESQRKFPVVACQEINIEEVQNDSIELSKALMQIPLVKKKSLPVVDDDMDFTSLADLVLSRY